MPPDFRGKVALVTGVGRLGQVGHAVAWGFAQAGARLVLADVNAAALADRAQELAARGHEAHVAAADLATLDGARRAVQVAQAQWGGLDAVVNVAGGLVHYGPALDITPEKFERELAINVKTTFYVSQAALPALVARGGGAIVNFASVAVLKPQAQMASYIAAKSAVAGLTRGLAIEFAGRGVRVNAVAPGTLRTGDNVASIKDTDMHWVEIADLVRVVLYLASDDAKAISGEVVAVTG